MPEQLNLFSKKTPSKEKNNKKKKEEKKPSAKKPAVRRRKKAATEVENYYALLEVDSDADFDTIKENYVKMVKKYPPETHAEKFRTIRQAYEVLQNEQKRKEYDILFLYGESIEDLIEEAQAGQRLTAAKLKLLERAVKIDPLHIKAQTSLATAHLIREGLESFEERFEIIKNTFSDQEWLNLWKLKIRILLDYDYPQEAFEELQQLQKLDPHILGNHSQLCLFVYGAVERETELLAAFEKYHNSLTNPTFEDLIIYIGWIKIADILFREEKMPTARRATEKFIRNFSAQEERTRIAVILTEEYNSAYESKNVGCAKALIDLAVFADKNNKKLKQYSQQLQKVSSLYEEINKALTDQRIFAPIVLEIISDFVEEFGLEDSTLGMMGGEYSEIVYDSFVDMLGGSDLTEMYAAGIFRLKKKYPLLYRHYQTQLEAILKEKTMGMNREERRSFRY